MLYCEAYALLRGVCSTPLIQAMPRAICADRGLRTGGVWLIDAIEAAGVWLIDAMADRCQRALYLCSYMRKASRPNTRQYTSTNINVHTHTHTHTHTHVYIDREREREREKGAERRKESGLIAA